MPLNKIPKAVADFDKKLPHFPDGRIDYTNSGSAPVLICFIKYQGKILLLKRSDKVLAYKGLWNTVAGFLDEPKSLIYKVEEELSEELGINKKDITDVSSGKVHNVADPTINRTWIVHPVLVTLNKKPKIKIDWEHTAYRWINPSEIKKFETTPKLNLTLSKVITI